ncbi:site-2 protease family protein [Candidatus Formimonas warabiya]|uniref:CBS domain-containing protein n=1 Tax=Formimonas warabiya TaxID=1761012 RepID=A0A3G1KSQ1_FORW1|nr:site-2 protease family protein [Candidatus Formimonas warabiya]ATW25488.1 hypothetical protein DCMF_12510 [Candidatus Formimonas warabiya]
MRIGRVRGIELKVSNYLLALLLVYYFVGLLDKALMVFAVVLIHEIGHVGLALFWGIGVESVELFPFGAVARMKQAHLYSLNKEIAIAALGPLINFILGAFFWLALHFQLGNGDVFYFLIQVTVLMGLFNLIPVWPFDGGRICRAILARWTGFFYAARLVSTLGQFCAALFFLFGTWAVFQSWSNFHWWLIAGYLYYVARQEKKWAFLSFMRYLTRKDKEIDREGHLPAVVVVAMSRVRLRQIIEKLVPHQYYLIGVLDDEGKLLGFITEKTVIREALKGGMHITLEEVLNKTGN